MICPESNKECTSVYCKDGLCGMAFSVRDVPEDLVIVSRSDLESAIFSLQRQNQPLHHDQHTVTCIWKEILNLKAAS